MPDALTTTIRTALRLGIRVALDYGDCYAPYGCLMIACAGGHWVKIVGWN
jgi:hypothetical protein